MLCLFKLAVDHLHGPFGPERPRKSLKKKVSRGRRPRDPPRVWKSLKKVLRSLVQVSKRSQKDFVETFSKLSRRAQDRRAPADFFLTFSGFREARETPANGQRAPNFKLYCCLTLLCFWRRENFSGVPP